MTIGLIELSQYWLVFLPLLLLFAWLLVYATMR